jgi:hypothetical protein
MALARIVAAGDVKAIFREIDANFIDLDERSRAVESADPANTRLEVENARGSRSSLQDYLSVSHNDDGSLNFTAAKEVSLRLLPVAPIYVSGQTFKVSGDWRDFFKAGLVLEFADNSDVLANGTTQAVSFDAVADETSITLTEAVIMNGVAAVRVAFLRVDETDLNAMAQALIDGNRRFLSLFFDHLETKEKLDALQSEMDGLREMLKV